MKIQKFEDIIAWQKAQDFAESVYKIFGDSKDFGFRDQICRAAVSVSNNIAEGFDRGSNADFRRFLFFSIGSCSEVKSMLYLAERLNYIDTNTKNKLIEQGNEISKIIRGFIKTLTTKKLTTKKLTTKKLTTKKLTTKKLTTKKLTTKN